MSDQPITLSQISPNYEQLLAAFQQAFIQSGAHTDFSTSNFGRQLVEIMAQIGEYSQFGIEQAVQESNDITASLESSVYSAVLLKGVRIKRRVPAQVEVLLFRDLANIQVIIPAYSQFSMGTGIKLFNNADIIMNVGVDQIAVVLYEGQITNEQYSSPGTSFQKYLIGNEAFAISDTDLLCYVDSVPFTRVTDGLYNYSQAQSVFHERTTADGRVQVMFGNNIYGVAPNQSQAILFRYAITQGAAGNGSTGDGSVTLISNTLIKGQTQSALAGGTDDLGIDYYKTVSSKLYAANNIGTTKSALYGLVLSYPGVLDCIIRGQKDIAPNNVLYMNTVQLTILTDPVWTATQWQTFIEWLQPKSLATVHYIRNDPPSITVNIDMTVYCFANSDLTDVKNRVTGAIQTKFVVGRGSLGKSLQLSDITDAALSAYPASVQNQYIDYLKINSPSSEVSVQTGAYIKIGTVTVAAEYSTRAPLSNP